MCVQARRHKEEAEQKAEGLQLQLSHLQDLLSRLKDDKTTMVSNCNYRTNTNYIYSLYSVAFINSMYVSVYVKI